MLAVLPDLERKPFIVHALPATASIEPVPLQRANKLCTDRPSIVSCRSTSDESVRARCVVPKQMVGNSFGATRWLAEFANAFDGELADAQKGQSPDEVAVMKARKVSDVEYDALLTEAVRRAESFAETNCVARVKRASGDID